MSKDTKIEWCHHTFNPWWGCAKVSEACRNCYAETLAKRVGKDFAERVRTKGPWTDLVKWDIDAGKRGVRERVFVGSMCDIGEDHPAVEGWRTEAFTLLESLKNLDVLLLTKRPNHLRQMLNGFLQGDELPRHFWVGCTVENQAMADERLPELLKIENAAVRFISVEPMLGRIDVPRGIDWVICGGESGGKARPMHPAGPRDLRRQCQALGIPFLFKQWGEWAPYRWEGEPTRAGDVVCTRRAMFHIDRDGAMPAMTSRRFDIVRRVGKVAAGRELDGQLHDEYPVTEVMAPPESAPAAGLFEFMDEMNDPGHWA